MSADFNEWWEAHQRGHSTEWLLHEKLSQNCVRAAWDARQPEIDTLQAENERLKTEPPPGSLAAASYGRGYDAGVASLQAQLRESEQRVEQAEKIAKFQDDNYGAELVALRRVRDAAKSVLEAEERYMTDLETQGSMLAAHLVGAIHLLRSALADSQPTSGGGSSR